VGLDDFIALGGRGIDTAWSYRNQPSVGRAVRNASVPRSELFLTTKIECMGTAEAAYAAIELDLKQLGLDHVDLVLIHAPYKAFGEPYSNCSEGPAGAAARRATWKGMERAVRANLTRAIGVSNFDVECVTNTHAPLNPTVVVLSYGEEYIRNIQ
jgi:diketogulonate reductase-like aldo/keto reductase